jgi:hypothetical protein
VLAAKCTTCGHLEADHKSNRGLDRAFGVCLVEGCPCREFTSVQRDLETLTKAALTPVEERRP